MTTNSWFVVWFIGTDIVKNSVLNNLSMTNSVLFGSCLFIPGSGRSAIWRFSSLCIVGDWYY